MPHRYGDIRFDMSLSLPAPAQSRRVVGPDAAGQRVGLRRTVGLRQDDLRQGWCSGCTASSWRCIEIDGTGYADVTQESLRRQVAIVQQEPIPSTARWPEHRLRPPDASRWRSMQAARARPSPTPSSSGCRCATPPWSASAASSSRGDERAASSDRACPPGRRADPGPGRSHLEASTGRGRRR